MQTNFEKWLNNQKNISGLSKEIFTEAISCYKIQAYRAAMILSYTGFLTLLKYKISNSSKPDNINDTLWQAYRSKLADSIHEDSWEHFLVQDIVLTTRAEKKLFDLTESTRDQVKYWKDRRNDAAHSKSNKISYALIESFWDFLESNLSKFAVINSQEVTINQIKDYFDLDITPLHANADEIISLIPQGTDAASLPAFIDRVVRICLDSNRLPSQKLKFLNAILNLPETQQELIRYFLKRENLKLLHVMLLTYPNQFYLFSNDETFTRVLWKKMLFSGTGMFGWDDDFIETTQYEIGAFKLLSSIVRNGLIPDGERIEANKLLFKRWYRAFKLNNLFVPAAEDSEAFKQTVVKYWHERIIEKVDERHDYYSWGNVNYQLVLDYVKLVELDEAIVQILCVSFSKAACAFTLRNRLKDFFAEPANEAVKTRFINIATENGFTIPNHWELQETAVTTHIENSDE